MRDEQGDFNRDEALVIFTDGSCIDNGKPTAKGGIGIVFPDELGLENISEPIVENPTNNKAELLAIKTALFNDYILSQIKLGRLITIYTDSDYSIQSLTTYAEIQKKNNWHNSSGKRIANYELIRPLYDLLLRYKNITLKHIYAHTGKKDSVSVGNDLADRLAFSASSGKPLNSIGNMSNSQIFPFGKYKGKSIEEITSSDGNYIVWCKKNKTMPNLVKYSKFIDSL